MALEEFSSESINGRTTRRMDGRRDRWTYNGQKVITIAHHEHSSGELKILVYFFFHADAIYKISGF